MLSFTYIFILSLAGEMVGYPEPNYFSYVFKKNCGVSPAKYRKLENEK